MKEKILKEQEISTHLSTIKGALTLLEELLADLSREAFADEEFRVINARDNLATAFRSLQYVREGMHLEHIVD
jgi:hypothetical protein